MLNILKEDESILRVETVDFNTIHRISELDESLSKIHNQLEFMASEILFLKQKIDVRTKEHRSCSRIGLVALMGTITSISVGVCAMYVQYMNGLGPIYTEFIYT